MTTRKPTAKHEPAEAAAETCDNHPARVAVVTTTTGGAHSEIRLCRECARAAGRL